MGKQASKLKGYNNVFATRLRDLMAKRQITQETLAEQVGCSRQAISQYTDGSTVPNFDKLLGIAKFFNISADYLLGLTNVETNVESLIKQEPKKPSGDWHSVPHYRCPTCHSAVKIFSDDKTYPYCQFCGQALDWSE